MADRQQYVYRFLPGDRPRLATDPDAWTDADNRIAEAHYRRLRKAAEDGVLILAGLSLDGSGPAIVIFEAEDEEEGRRFMQEDPFVEHGLFKATLHPFRASLVRGTEGTKARAAGR
ncbi:MAG: YciI family protein [Acidimicrobiia bacterium]